ncbi:MAG TPA: LysM peptidoglycan-binding domain-containing protein, partial [Anaerolineae bacterium]|nr:LysM peptidoglycan-binding domain-containing protein [Anaerolineae bacterium]
SKMVPLVSIGAILIAIFTFLALRSFVSGGDDTGDDQLAVPTQAATAVLGPENVGGVTQPDMSGADLVAQMTQTAQAAFFDPNTTANVVMPTVDTVATTNAVIATSQAQQALQAQQQQQQAAPTLTPWPTATPWVQQAAPTAIPPVSSGGVQFINHTVVAGDTLFSISQRYGTTIELMAEYNIAANDLVPGQILRIPTSGGGNCGANTSHIVSPGDNVFRIALRYGTTSAAIQQLNGLNANYLIKVNQVLCIPAS